MKNILHIIIINYAKYYWTLKSFAIIFHIFLIPVIQSWEELMQSNIGHKSLNMCVKYMSTDKKHYSIYLEWSVGNICTYILHICCGRFFFIFSMNKILLRNVVKIYFMYKYIKYYIDNVLRFTVG